MNLLRAELRKLRRPLPFGLLAAAFVICAITARQQVVTSAAHTPSGIASAQLMESPFGIGKLAAGEMASLLGLVVMLFLAGAHLGGEWSGRTLKAVLTAEPRRGRVLLAKFTSLWVASVAILTFLWACLAVWSIVLTHLWPTPGQLSLGDAVRIAGPDLLRAPVVIAAFAALALCAAVLTRSILGTVILGIAVIGVSMEVGNISSLAHYSPSYWVDGWMGFKPPAHGVMTYAIWNTAVPSNVPEPGVIVGLVGLAVLVALTGAISWARFRRMDVTC